MHVCIYIDYRNFCIIGNKANVSKVVDIMIQNSNNITYINNILNYMNKIRYYYTYAGVIEQIHMFLKDPFGMNGGHLKCAKVPDHFSHYREPSI